MSTMTNTESTPEITTGADYRVTWPRVVRSEWAKLWTLRSTWITLAVTLVVLIGFATIAAYEFTSSTGSTGADPMQDLQNATALSLTTFGVGIGQLALVVLGVLFAAGEYSTGSIRSTLAAVPKRLPVLGAKAAVYGLVAFLAGAAGTFAGFLIANTIVSGTEAHLSLTDSPVLRALAGTGLYLGLMGVISMALGVLLRSVAGGIASMVAVLLLVPGLMGTLPSAWRDNINPYLPSSTGDSLNSLDQVSGMLSPGGAALVLVGWTALALAGAGWRLLRTDA